MHPASPARSARPPTVTATPGIAKGIDVLYESTYNGLNGVMPARGTCMDCSDEELQATVDYMVAAAGRQRSKASTASGPFSF